MAENSGVSTLYGIAGAQKFIYRIFYSPAARDRDAGAPAAEPEL